MTFESISSRASKLSLMFAVVSCGLIFGSMAGCGGATPQTTDMSDAKIEFDQVAVDMDEQAQREKEASEMTEVREVGE